jgi:hypothetical protein
VEKSTDNLHFSAVGSLAVQPLTAAVKQYTYTDISPGTSKTVYYRIQAMDVAGSYTYSKVVSFSESLRMQTLLVPNPTQAETTLYVTTEKDQTITIELSDGMGRAMLNRKMPVTAGRNAITLSELLSYPRGHYIVRVTTALETQHLKLVLK